MVHNAPSSYEPYSHAERSDGDHAEKPLVPNENEKRYPEHRKKRDASQHFRIGLRAMVLAVAASILAVQIHSAYIWLSTRHATTLNPKTGFQTSAWPFLYAGPTWTMIGAAAITAVIHSLSLLTLCSCWHMHESRWHALSVYFTSAGIIAFWLAAVVYFKVVDSQGPNRDHWDLWSWTCFRKGQRSSIPWTTLCTENQYTFIASVVVLIIEIISLLIFIVAQQRLTKSKSGSAWRGYMRMK